MINSNSTIFQHDCVNDLYTAIFSPELRQHQHSIDITLTAARLAWLQQLDINPTELKASTSSEQRLGHYYEDLWAFFLKQDSQFEVIAHNLVIRDEHRTIGEFDFIFFDQKAQQHIHLEVAIKFYLFYQAHHSQQASNPNFWFGPNSQDTLNKKFTHLTNKQRKLNEHPCAKKMLEQFGIDNLETKISLKGYLFSQNSKETPEGFINNNRIHGYKFINQFSTEKIDCLYILPKNRWIGKAHENLVAFSLEETIAKINKTQSPVLLAYCQKEYGRYIEQERFFICPESWPYSLIKPYKSLNNSI